MEKPQEEIVKERVKDLQEKPLSLEDLPAYLAQLREKYEVIEDDTEELEAQMNSCLVDMGKIIVE